MAAQAREWGWSRAEQECVFVQVSPQRSNAFLRCLFDSLFVGAAPAEDNQPAKWGKTRLAALGQFAMRESFVILL